MSADISHEQSSRNLYINTKKKSKNLLSAGVVIGINPVLSWQIGNLQERLRDGHVSTKDHHSVLKSELARRDETIQKLRRDVLSLQEKRDAAVSEVRMPSLTVMNK